METTLYDINKAIYRRKELLVEYDEAIETINAFHKNEQSKYYLLLCREYNYITMFDFVPNGTVDFESLGSGVIGCIIDSKFEGIYSAEYIEEDNAVEIWVKRDEEPCVMYLCDGTPSVITIKED